LTHASAMSLQQLLRLGASGLTGLTQGDAQPDSSHATGHSAGGKPESSELDLSAAVAKAASFLEKQKAARLRGERRGETSHGDRERGRERSRSRKKDADANPRPDRTRSRRRERSGSRATAMKRTSRPRHRSTPAGAGSAGTTRGRSAAGSRRPSTARSPPSSRTRQPSPAAEMSLQEAPLKFAGRIGPIAANSRSSGWISVLSDEKRRSWVSYRSGAFKPEQLRAWFDQLLNGLNWERPEVHGKPLPRSACWLTTAGCSCTYRYSGTSWPNMVMPQWFVDLTDEVCRACEVPERPNSCNANLYEDGGDSVGWHADDEPYFDAKHTDALIISLSLGATRTFLLRPNDAPTQKTKLFLENGDLATMEGRLQKHYSHAVLADGSNGVRINLTWRWVLVHDRGCAKRGNGRAASEPVRVPRKAAGDETKKAATQAAALSTAAAVQSRAMQVAAASAASAKLSRASSATATQHTFGRDGGRATPVLRPQSPGTSRVQGDRAERDRATQPQAKLLRLPEDLSTSGQGSVPEFSEIMDKARRLMGPEPTDGASQRHRATSSTASEVRGSGARDRRTDQQERGRSNMEQAADVGTSSAGRDPGLSNNLTGARDVVPSSDARRDEDGRDEHTRSRRQVSLKEADQASRGHRQSGAPAANALDEEIYSKAVKLMGPDAVQRPAALRESAADDPHGRHEKAVPRVGARVWKASTKASATDGRARAESEAGAGAAGSSAHRPHRPSEPQEPHRSDVARSDKKGSTPAQGQGQRKGTKVDLQKAAPDASAAGQGRHEKLVLTPRHITVGPGDGHGGHGEARTYSAGAASLTATRGSGSGHGESDRIWRHVSEADRGRGHRGERTTAEPDEQMHGKAVKLTGSNAVQRGEAGASSRAESSQGSPAAADKGRVWRGKDRGEASSRGTGQPQRAEDGWDEEIYDYSADQYREPVSARRDEGRPLPPRPPLARPRQVVLKSRSRSPKSFAARDTDRHGARAHGGHKEEADHSYREWPRAVANGAQHFSYEEHRGPGPDDPPSSRGDARGSGQTRHTPSTGDRSNAGSSIADRLAECDSRPREAPRSHGNAASRWRGSTRR